MKEELGRTIQQLRKVQCYTQEQMADAVGVSVAAVSKWENGVSCPDVTMLPVLARYLDTDVNTLLSFHKKLSEAEAASLINRLPDIFFDSGFETAYAFLMEKIREYPGSDMLVLNGAMTLSGVLVMGGDREAAERYEEEIERLYEKAAESEDPAVGSQARYMLASKYMGRGDYDRAEALIDRLLDEPAYDKRQMQVNLCLARNQLADAGEMEERKLMLAASSLSMVLVTLIEIACKEGRTEDARYLAEAAERTARALDMWEYTAQLPWLELYTHMEDRDNCLKTLRSMLASVTDGWDYTSSPLYRHMRKKEGEERLGSRMREMLLSTVESTLEHDERYAFLRDSEEWNWIISAGGGTDRGAGRDET